MTADRIPQPGPNRLMGTIDVKRAADRASTRIGWLDSWHSFNFGSHFDPTNQPHGLLIVSNDDRVAPGAGFGTHGHRDMEIVTWVLDGALEHRDSAGNHGVLRPGLAQRMSAGRGIQHSEMNASADEPVHFVQMWVVPDRAGIEPAYGQRDKSHELDAGGLVAIVSGKGHEGAISIHQADAAMWVARMQPGDEVTLPDAPFVHVFVARGAVRLPDRQLDEGDAARLFEAGPIWVAADRESEIIVWESDSEVK